MVRDASLAVEFNLKGQQVEVKRLACVARAVFFAFSVLVTVLCHTIVDMGGHVFPQGKYPMGYSQMMGLGFGFVAWTWIFYRWRKDGEHSFLIT